MKGRARFAVTAIMLALLLVAAACQRQQQPTTPTVEVEPGGSIVVAAEQEQTGFNINTSKDSLFWLGIIINKIWPSAYATNPDFSLVPDLIDGPAEVVTESPFVVEWKIREEAEWDDGTPISADDFEFVYENCNGKNEESDCASTQGYDQITKFEKVDAKTVRATFEPAYVEYESLFSTLPPSHLGKTRPGGWNTGFDADPGASGGPFKLKEWVKGDHTTIVRNDQYWGETKANPDEIIFRQIPDPAQAPDALRNNEVQVIYPSPQVDLVTQIEAISGIKSEVGFGPTWEHLDFNFSNPLLAIKEVRQAFAWGLDREAITTALMKPFSDEASTLQNRVFVSNQKEYEAHGQEYAKRDVAKAQDALTKAGFTKGSDGIFQKDGQKLSFRLRVRTPNPLREQNEQLMQAQMKEVGIDLRIDNFSTSLGAALAQGDFDLIIFAWVGTPFAASGAKQIFETGSDSNFGKYSNPKVDDLVAKANSELDKDERVDLLNQADEAMWEDLPNLPLFQRPSGLLAFTERLGNVVDNTTTSGPTWNAERWGYLKPE